MRKEPVQYVYTGSAGNSHGRDVPESRTPMTAPLGNG